MANIALLAPTPHDLSAFGVRSLSSYLKSKGHRVRIVFFPGSIGLLKEGGGFVYSYPERVVEQAMDLCRGFDLVGVSFFTNYFDRAVQLTRAVRERLCIPVVWGGIHATCKPREALSQADFVCVGEGEEALDELLTALAAGAATTAIPGVWARRGDEIVDNGARPLIADLDSLPLFDFSHQDHFLFAPERGAIIPMDDEAFFHVLPRVPYFGHALIPVYRTMTDRGCPHHCAYCNVPTVKRLFAGGPTPYFRSRSVAHVMDELRRTTARHPFIKGIQLFDDTFFSRPLSWLREFAAAYKAEIGLPLYCQASPTTLSAEKLDLLIEAGLVYVEMGVQTGSARIRKIFDRAESNDKILAGARLINDRLPRLLPPDYHVIIESPWETPDDLLDTVRLLHAIPKPFGLAISSLVFFPETELYKKALAEGLIADETADIYRKPFYVPPKKTYPAFLLYLTTFQHFPRRLLDLLLTERAIRFFTRTNPTRLYAAGYVLGEAARLAAKGLFALARGDVRRIAGYFKRLMLRDPVAAGRKG